MLLCFLPCTWADEPACLSSMRGFRFEIAALDGISLRQADMVS